MKPASELIGLKFGRLTVIGRERNIGGNTNWRCRCECGNETAVIAIHLTGGNTKSCGCLKRIQAVANFTTHGQSKTRVYEVWSGMMRRCYNQRRRDYPRYGGRGIVVCDRWHKFENFLADMGEPPAGLTIEREDSNGPYAPDNCSWASRATQGGNTSRVIKVIVAGKSMSLRQACALTGKNYHTIYMRVRRGSSVEEAMR